MSSVCWKVTYREGKGPENVLLLASQPEALKVEAFLQQVLKGDGAVRVEEEPIFDSFMGLLESLRRFVRAERKQA